jgi:hypothetical protein
MDKIVFFSGEYVIILVQLVCHVPIRQLQPEDGTKEKLKHVVVNIVSKSFRYIFYTIKSCVRLSNYIYFKY